MFISPEEETFANLADILYASVLGNHFLILNSLEDAQELLERRASIYSDRPVFPIIKM